MGFQASEEPLRSPGASPAATVLCLLKCPRSLLWINLDGYRDYPDFVGATFPGKMCVTHYSAGIALYPKEITLEAFSVIITQMLGLSLGISYDDPKKCQCSGAICIMNPEAMNRYPILFQ